MLIILEGMSTTGKTMVQNALADILTKKKIKYQIVDQNEGLPPETFVHRNPQKSLDFLMNYLKNNCAGKNTVYIFDRFHLSHFAITNGPTEYIVQIEQEILKYDPLLVLLTVDENKVKDRLEGAIQYRGDQWIENLALKGENRDEQAKWHLGTQRKHIQQFEISNLPKAEFNTTYSNFGKVAQNIYEQYIKPIVDER